MAWFRRKATGRHALGAAVTSIPSGPLFAGAVLPAVPDPPAPVPSVPALVTAPPAVVAPGPEPVAEPELMTSIAALLASGEAWSDAPAGPAPRPGVAAPESDVVVAPAAVFTTDAATRATHLPPVPAPEGPPALVPVAAAPSPAAQAPSLVVPEPAQAAAPASPSDPSSLEAALSELLLPQAAAQDIAAAAAPPPPTAPRVQLGFRDGTSTTLEPGSSQALALEQLALSLTRRD